MNKTKPHKEVEWKVEPLPAADRVEDLRAPEIVALLAAACSRIRMLEAQMSELQSSDRLSP